MIETIALFAALTVGSVLLIKLMANWSEGWFVHSITSLLDDAGCIVNEGKLPEAWVRPFCRRIEAIRRKGGSESKMERVGHQARQRCLRKLDGLIKFFRERNVTDSEETRKFLLTSLQERRVWVATASWQDLLEPETGAQDTAEPPVED
jgi:hypothetical protein